jgi:hypothetical protein
MSKTYGKTHTKRVDQTPQKAIDRLRMEEAQEEIKEALIASEERTNVNQ